MELYRLSYWGFDGWLVVLRINVDLAIFQPYLDLEAGENQSLKIQLARPGIEPRSSCSARQELNHLATTAPWGFDESCPIKVTFIHTCTSDTDVYIGIGMRMMK